MATNDGYGKENAHDLRNIGARDVHKNISFSLEIAKNQDLTAETPRAGRCSLKTRIGLRTNGQAQTSLSICF